MDKLSANRALFLRNKYTVFTMGSTVALRSVNKIFSESYRLAAINIYNAYQMFALPSPCHALILLCRSFFHWYNRVH